MPTVADGSVLVPGSDRRPLPGARELGPALPGSTARVTLWLRRNPGSTLAANGRERIRVGRSEFARHHGASTDDLEVVHAFAEQFDLTRIASSSARRSVWLSGTVDRLEAAFGVRLRRFAHPRGSYRGRVGPVYLPRTVAAVTEAVLGLDDRPQARTHFRRYRGPLAEAEAETPTAVGNAYQFPPGTAAGQCIGLVELGGGYSASDLASFFSGSGLPAPSVTAVSVDGATNAPTGSPDGPDGEVELDLEIAGALAPGARLAVYFAPNTDQGFLDALTAAAHDATNRPTVISISWGGPEPSWTPQAMNALSSAAEDAAAHGVTTIAAAGDQGASDGESGGTLAVDFPSSSPFVLGCGGTRLTLSGTTVASEVVWDDLSSGSGATGGGVSVTFPRPGFQSAANVPTAPNGFVGRGVPDVAGDADPSTGYSLWVDGEAVVLGGTSAVAPLWAALVARLNAALGRELGDPHALFYAQGASGGFSEITQGSNGGYSAGPGWNPCTGLGSPRGSALLAALRSTPPA